MIRVTDSARALLAGFSIFVLGIVVGCGVDRSILTAPTYAAAASDRHAAPRHHDAVLAELRAELGLSPEQSRRVQDIFAARQGELEATWQQVHANLQRAMQQTTTEIETVLDSAQIERLHAWLAERHGPTSRHGARQEH